MEAFSRPKCGGKKKGKNQEILGLHCVAKNIEGWLKICTVFLVLDLAKSWLPLFLHVPMDDCHFGYTQKFLEPITYIPLGMLATNAMLENWKRKTLMNYSLWFEASPLMKFNFQFFWKI